MVSRGSLLLVLVGVVLLGVSDALVISLPGTAVTGVCAGASVSSCAPAECGRAQLRLASNPTVDYCKDKSSGGRLVPPAPMSTNQFLASVGVGVTFNDNETFSSDVDAEVNTNFN